MSSARGGLSAAGGGGGGCDMPELIHLREAFPSNTPEFTPTFTLLNELNSQYKRALSNPSIAETVRNDLLGRILTPYVKVQIFPILAQLFDARVGGDVTQADIDRILNCILEALSKDLPLISIISMVARMYLKAFYNNSPVRLALAVSFVGSSGYLAWVGGMNQLASLGTTTCATILSIMANCAHLGYDPAQYLQQYNSILGESFVNSLGGTIEFIIPSPGSAFAMSTVFLMGQIYGSGQFPPAHDLLQAHQGARGGVALNMPAAAAAAVPALEPVEVAAAMAAAGALAAGGDAAAATAAATAARTNADLINDATAAIAAAATAAAAAAGPAAAGPAAAADSIFRIMFNELVNVAGVVKTVTINHLCRLVDLCREIVHTRPGQMVNQTNSIGYRANVCAIACINSFIDTLDTQAANVGLDREIMRSYGLLESMFPCSMRERNETKAKQEIILTAHRIKDAVIECLKRTDANYDITKLERACVVFTSELTKAKIDAFNSRELGHILEMLILAAQEVQFEVPNDEVADALADDPQLYQEPSDSMEVAGSYTPLHGRNDDIKELFDRALQDNPRVFRTEEEKNMVRAKSGIYNATFGWIDSIVGLCKQSRDAKFFQCVSTEIREVGRGMAHSIGRPGLGAEVALLRRPDLFPFIASLERLLTGPWAPVLADISRMKMDERKEYAEIVGILCEKYNITRREDFVGYLRMLSTRAKLEKIMNLNGDLKLVIRRLSRPGPNGTVEFFNRGDLTMGIGGSNLAINERGMFEALAILSFDFVDANYTLPRLANSTLVAAKEVGSSLKNKLWNSVNSLGCMIPGGQGPAVVAAEEQLNPVVELMDRLPPAAAVVPPEAAGVPPEAAVVPPEAAGVPPEAAGVPPEAAGVPAENALMPPSLSMELVHTANGVMNVMCDIESEYQLVSRAGDGGGGAGDGAAAAAAASAAGDDAEVRRVTLAAHVEPMMIAERIPPGQEGDVSEGAAAENRVLKRGSEKAHGADIPGGKGGSRTRRRRSSSSTRSSTTRGRKATSRRNQSKKHKQSSRRRRSSRKASRKN
jgi:hypothetical protein